MNGAVSAGVLDWLSAGLAACAIAAAIGVAQARAVFASVMQFAACSAFVGAALLAKGDGGAGLALLLWGVGLAPALLLVVTTLTARSIKSRPRGTPRVVMGLAVVAWMLLVAGAAQRGVANTLVIEQPALGAAAPWLAALALGAAGAAFALLALGERGAARGEAKAEGVEP